MKWSKPMSILKHSFSFSVKGIVGISQKLTEKQEYVQNYTMQFFFSINVWEFLNTSIYVEGYVFKLNGFNFKKIFSVFIEIGTMNAN